MPNPPKKRIASAVKPKDGPTPVLVNADAELLNSASAAEAQDTIDRSLTRDFEGIGPRIAGVSLRPLSMSAIMKLYEVENEIMAGKKVSDMTNSLYSAMEFLFMLDEAGDAKEIARLAFGPRLNWKVAVSVWGEDVEMSDTVVSEVIDFINESTASRVNASLPESLKSDSDLEEEIESGNE